MTRNDHPFDVGGGASVANGVSFNGMSFMGGSPDTRRHGYASSIDANYGSPFSRSVQGGSWVPQGSSRGPSSVQQISSNKQATPRLGTTVIAEEELESIGVSPENLAG